MKKTSVLKYGTLATSMMLSAVSWSLGTAVDLGEILLKPGITMLELNKTGLHKKVPYVVNCSMEPLTEASALLISERNLQWMQIWIDGVKKLKNSILQIPENKPLAIKLTNVYRTGNDENAINFSNLDQIQTFSMHCVADIDHSNTEL